MNIFTHLHRRTLLAAAGAVLLLTIAVPKTFGQGSLHAWGDDTYGLVSHIPAGNDFVKVSLGGSHGVALRSNGTLVSWGDNSIGQVSGTPTGTFVDISAGIEGSAALRADGTIVTWGYVSNVPAGTFTSLASHFYDFPVALRADGTFAPGYSGFAGPLPAGSFVSGDVSEILGAALRADGELVVWGTYSASGAPANAIPGPFRAVSCGEFGFAAVRTDGTAVAWGDELLYSSFPPAPPGAFSTVDSGLVFNVGLRTNGSLASWGYDDGGAVSGTPAGDGFIAVSASYNTGIAIHYEPTSIPDADGDGLTDATEALLGTNPTLPDTDLDGLLDGTEVNSSLTNPLDSDSDNDGLSDGVEVNLGTNPNNSDTDGDGISDSQDPTPLVPGATSSWIEARLRSDAAYVLGLSLSLIDAPNANAAKGRRNAMGNKLTEAANKIAQGDRAGAISDLVSLREKLDGNPSPADWMVAGDAKDALHAELQLLINLLGQP